MTVEEFIQKAKLIHGDKYNYSKVNYKNNKKKVEIICPIHGSFFQIPSNHFRNQGCSECGKEKEKENKFIKSKERFYKFVLDNNFKIIGEYTGSHSYIKLKCKNNHEFSVMPTSFYSNPRCSVCEKKYYPRTKERLEKILKDNYPKYKIVSENNKEVLINCPIHGNFKKTYGQVINNLCQCPTCSLKIIQSKGASKVEKYLNNNKISYIKEKKFKNCKDKLFLPFDFYIPEKNICIEFDGIQHYKQKSFGASEEEAAKNFNLTKKHDEIKNIYCEKNKIKLIRIKYNENVEKVLTEELWERN